ncbi:hypothetical protein Ancab_017280 [Ancistrocladus abbreviatus]
MEAFSSSYCVAPKLSETNSVLQTHLFSIKQSNKQIGYVKLSESLGFSSLGLTFERVGPSRSRVLAVSKEVSGESEDNTASGGNGFGLVSEDSITVAEANSSQNQSSANALDDSSKLPTPLTIGFGSGSGTGGGTRAGLFRTPISGGV